VCELALTGQDREYELRVPATWNPTGVPVERFDDALTAFQRHAMIERQLLDDGWLLAEFESERVTLHLCVSAMFILCTLVVSLSNHEHVWAGQVCRTQQTRYFL
jgi:hypothetical protein